MVPSIICAHESIERDKKSESEAQNHVESFGAFVKLRGGRGEPTSPSTVSTIKMRRKREWQIRKC
jgi:hypothetical protein